MSHNVLTEETLARVLFEQKQKGFDVCLTHGAFDMFHLSHLDMLTKSSKVADVLVVGIESDRRVAEYKPTRPVITEESRAAIVGSLPFVDYVFIKDIDFSDSEQIRLYRHLGVDCFTVGKHFNEKADKQIRSNCEVLKIAFKELDVNQGYTTSQIIRKVKDIAEE